MRNAEFNGLQAKSTSRDETRVTIFSSSFAFRFALCRHLPRLLRFYDKQEWEISSAAGGSLPG
jgi:hypothetical protein